MNLTGDYIWSAERPVTGRNAGISRTSGQTTNSGGLASVGRRPEFAESVTTLEPLDWLGDVELRRQTSLELNKDETRNSLARAVFIHRLGEIRDRTYENQQHRASGLNLLVNAGILTVFQKSFRTFS